MQQESSQNLQNPNENELSVVISRNIQFNDMYYRQMNKQDRSILKANLSDNLQTSLEFEELEVTSVIDYLPVILKTNRETLCEKLLLLKDNEEARKFLAKEIIAAFFAYMETNGGEGVCPPRDNQEWQALRRDYENKKEEFGELYWDRMRNRNKLFGEIVTVRGKDIEEISLEWLEKNNESDAIEMHKEKKRDISDIKMQLEVFCEKIDIFEYYINALRTSRRLGCNSALLYAKCVDMTLYVWKKDTQNKNQLALVGCHVARNNTSDDIHLLHIHRFTHFNFLVDSKKISDESNLENIQRYCAHAQSIEFKMRLDDAIKNYQGGKLSIDMFSIHEVRGFVDQYEKGEITSFNMDTKAFEKKNSTVEELKKIIGSNISCTFFYHEADSRVKVSRKTVSVPVRHRIELDEDSTSLLLEKTPEMQNTSPSSYLQNAVII